MTNETNEQKPTNANVCKDCGLTHIVEGQCPNSHIAPPQEVEATSEYLNPPPYDPYASMEPHEYPVKFDQNSIESNFIDAWLNMDINGRNYQRICEMLQAYYAYRLRSSMGKVPEFTNEMAMEMLGKSPRDGYEHCRSEVAPVIARLEEENAQLKKNLEGNRL